MHALALIEAPRHVCSRYRIEPFVGAVEAAGGRLSIEALERNPLKRAIQLARTSRFDAVLLQRKLLPAWQLSILRRSARRLIFDFDDAVPHRDSNDPRGPHCPRRMARFRSLMRCVDGVLAGNGFLCELAEAAGALHSRIRRMPTTIDLSRYPAEPDRPEHDGGATLVWIGSSSTLAGIERRREVWERLGGEVRPAPRLKVICDRFPVFASLQVEAVPWDGATEVAQLVASDVGVSLIPDDLWSRGKCGLKVLQYLAAGLPVLANPVGVHPEMIEDGQNGRLVDSADDWVDAVVELTFRPELRRTLGRNARRVVETAYSVPAWSSTFVATLLGTSAEPAITPHGAVRGLRSKSRFPVVAEDDPHV